MREIDSIELANYVLLKGGRMSHIKLQKIIYYLDAYHLALFGASLIDDEFEAWVHGPVSRKIWDQFKRHRLGVHDELDFNGNSYTTEKCIDQSVSSKQKEYIDRVINGIKNKTGDHLEALTHSEAPWRNARKGLSPEVASSRVISKNDMRSFYSEKYEKAKQKP